MNLQTVAKQSARRVLRRDQDERYKNEIAPECRYPVDWISKNFYIPETFTPIPLHESQVIPLAEALSTDSSGKFNYSTVVWSAVKKSAKSSIAAAVGLWFAARRPYSMIKVIANDQRQAESRVFYYMKRAIEIHPEWRTTVRATGSRIEFPNRSFIEAVAMDPKGEAGGNDDLVIYSEIWGWKTKAALQMWTETTLSPFKYGESMRWCETYAGYENDSPVLEDLYETGVTNGTPMNPDLEMYQNKEARQFTLWNTKPLLPWQTKEYYDQERASLDQSEFDRVHRNQWQTYQGRIFPTFDVQNITDEAEYNPAKGIIYWGCDDGYAYGKGPGSESYHPRVVLLAQKNSLGGLDIFAEYYETGVDNYEKTIDDVLKMGYPKPEAAYIDSSAPMFGAVLFRRGIYSVGATHDVIEGIKNTRRYICDANGVRLLRIHPRCVQLNREMRVYRHGDTSSSKSGEQTPKKMDDHGCLVAGTLIDTMDGQKAIEQIVPGDYVLTRDGYKRVKASGLTQMNAPIMRVTLSNGQSIEGTADHPVYVQGKGYTALRELIPCDILIASDSYKEQYQWQAKPSSTKESNSGVIPIPLIGQIETIIDLIQATSSEVFRRFISKFGKKRMGTFLKAMTFITRMATHSTTHWKTLNVSQNLNTLRRISPTNDWLSFVRTWMQFAHWLQSGIVPQKVGNGTLNMVSKHGQSVYYALMFVSNAGQNINPSVKAIPDFALMPVKQRGASNLALMTLSKLVNSADNPLSQTDTVRSAFAPVSVQQIIVTDQYKPVYNLTIETDTIGEYFANGILVHNCDAVRYLLAALAGII